MENIVADVVQFSCIIQYFSILECSLSLRLYFYLASRFSSTISKMDRQTMRQLVHSASRDNNLAPLHL